MKKILLFPALLIGLFMSVTVASANYYVNAFFGVPYLPMPSLPSLPDISITISKSTPKSYYSDSYYTPAPEPSYRKPTYNYYSKPPLANTSYSRPPTSAYYRPPTYNYVNPSYSYPSVSRYGGYDY